MKGTRVGFAAEFNQKLGRSAKRRGYDSMLYSGLCGLVVMLAASIGTALASGDQPVGRNRSEQTQEEPGVVGTRKLAVELYSYGKKAKDALAVLTAVALISKAPASRTSRGKTATELTQNGSKDDLAQVAPPDRSRMLAIARRLAGGNEKLLSLIDGLVSLTPKAPLVGAQWNVDVVASGGTSTYSITFRGGETAEIAVFCQGDAALRLRIFDEYDREICVEDGADKSTSTLYCSWRPKWTGPFHITIENRGSKDVALRVETN